MTVKLPDWEKRLRAYVSSVRRKPFKTGGNDCAIFVAGAIEAMTSVNPAKEYLGKYRTFEEGLALYKAKSGYIDPTDYLEKNFQKLHPSQGILGDIAVVGVPGIIDAMGLVNRSTIFVLTPIGLGNIPLLDARTLYRI